MVKRLKSLFGHCIVVSTMRKRKPKIMKHEVSVVHVFTHDKTPTLGNPAAVVVSPHMLSAPEMSALGMAAQQPITAFVSPIAASATEYDIRYYDLGGRECHICGHGTLAATAHLAQVIPDLDGQDILFHLNPELFNGQKKSLSTHVRGKELSLDLFPSLLRYENDPVLHTKIADVLGIQPSDIDIVAFSVNIRDYVVALKDHRVLLSMKPNFKAMKSMAESGPYAHEGLMVSCLAPEEDEHDLYVRVFLPITGVNEDIACGSGNCSIIPLWHDMKDLNRDKKRYKSVFPFPEGQEGYVGGIQLIEYAPEAHRITITAQANPGKKVVIDQNFARPSARARRALQV